MGGMMDGMPEKPLDLPEFGDQLWDVLISCRPAEQWRVEDVAILEGACRWYDRWRRFDADMPGDYKSMTCACAAYKQFVTSLSKLGMTPRDRKVLNLPQDPQRDELDALLE